LSRAAALAVVLAVLLLSAACGGGKELTPVPLGSPTAVPGTPAAGTPPACGPEGSAIAAIRREGNRRFTQPPPRVIDPAKTYTAVMETSRGVITIQLAAAGAPNTVNNFVYLSCEGYYDGLTFHRVEKNPAPFVIQGGDPRGDGAGGPGYRFANEISPNLRHDAAGVVAMANAGPNTNGSQFYVTLNPIPPLDGSYNVFGRVTAGMDAVNAIRIGDKIISVSIQER
jgi:peptidyl-prolyl cis-trans isomerase B (cyclophilin B)